MKKLIVLSITAFLIVFSCSTLHAQGPSVTTGSFTMASETSAAPVKTFYNVSPAGTDKVVLQLVPDQPFNLNARIVNAAGKTVQAIPAQDVTLRYAENIDVSTLPTGDYFIEIIYGDNKEKIHRIPFTK